MPSEVVVLETGENSLNNSCLSIVAEDASENAMICKAVRNDGFAECFEVASAFPIGEIQTRCVAFLQATGSEIRGSWLSQTVYGIFAVADVCEIGIIRTAKKTAHR